MLCVAADILHSARAVVWEVCVDSNRTGSVAEPRSFKERAKCVAKMSAGLLMYRFRQLASDELALEVLLGHPGGPFYRNQDHGAWTVPKGLLGPGEDAFHAACREFKEETGIQRVPNDLDAYVDLGEIRYKNGKVVRVWALEGTCEVSELSSNLFEIEWPPKSGEMIQVPELDRFEFFNLGEAKDKVHPAQLSFLQRLNKALLRKRAAGLLETTEI